MARPVAIIIFIIILLGSLGFFIYNVFDNTSYPDESEDLVNTTISEDYPLTDPKNLTQLTLQDIQQNMTKLPGDYLLPPKRTRFQYILQPLDN